MTETLNKTNSPIICAYIEKEGLHPYNAQKIIKNGILAFPLLFLLGIAGVVFSWSDLVRDRFPDTFPILTTSIWIIALIFVGFKTWIMASEYKKFDFLWSKSKSSLIGTAYISKNGKFGLLKRRMSLAGAYYSVIILPEFDDIECLEPNKLYRLRKGDDLYLLNTKESVLTKE